MVGCLGGNQYVSHILIVPAGDYSFDCNTGRGRTGAEEPGTEGKQPQFVKIERQSNAAASCCRRIENHDCQGQQVELVGVSPFLTWRIGGNDSRLCWLREGECGPACLQNCLIPQSAAAGGGRISARSRRRQCSFGSLSFRCAGAHRVASISKAGGMSSVLQRIALAHWRGDWSPPRDRP